MRWLAIIGLGLVLIAPDGAFAKGGYVRPPQLQPFRASILPTPEIALPTVALPAGTLVGGCRPRRYLDPATHQCRGPADVR